MRHTKFATKLALAFSSILLLFAISLVVFELPRERAHKRELQEERLDTYAQIVEAKQVRGQYESLKSLLPNDLRLTIIDKQGNVTYDNQSKQGIEENHASRPEILDARRSGNGSDLRLSATTKKEYLYYALRTPTGYVRVAQPYDAELRSLLRPSGAFFYTLMVLLAAGICVVYYSSRRFGKHIRRLRDFAFAVSFSRTHDNITPIEMPDFPNDETGDIYRQIANDYDKLRIANQELHAEREKLLMHVQAAQAGICFFTLYREVAFYNGLFLQYAKLLTERPVTKGDTAFLLSPVFAPIVEFINEPKGKNILQLQLNQQGRTLSLLVNLFNDRSFELVIADITARAASTALKQQLTDNIAHELRTPVTGIRGYLETILESQLSEEQQRAFVRNAYNQSLHLSSLIDNMSLLSRLDERPAEFNAQPVSLSNTIAEVSNTFGKALQEHKITLSSTVPTDATVCCNPTLLQVVFRNLVENAINYAGDNTTIYISEYAREANRLYISFADTGSGITDEQHLPLLFQRFYRIDSGRTRTAGGTGLGLSIVKNIIAMHGGTITARNRQGGGLELLFSLPIT